MSRMFLYFNVLADHSSNVSVYFTFNVFKIYATNPVKIVSFKINIIIPSKGDKNSLPSWLQSDAVALRYRGFFIIYTKVIIRNRFKT